MRTLIYLCLTSLLIAIGWDAIQVRRVLATGDGGKRIEFPGVVEVVTAHDKIPVATYYFGNAPIRNQRILGAAKNNPNLDARVNIEAGIVHIHRTRDLRWEETLRIDREREQDNLYNYGRALTIVHRAGGNYFDIVPPEATNWTTVAEIRRKEAVAEEEFRRAADLMSGTVRSVVFSNFTIVVVGSTNVSIGPIKFEPDHSRSNMPGYVRSEVAKGVWLGIDDNRYVWVPDSGPVHQHPSVKVLSNE